jgi:hypothetical protein
MIVTPPQCRVCGPLTGWLDVQPEPACCADAALPYRHAAATMAAASLIEWVMLVTPERHIGKAGGGRFRSTSAGERRD